MRKNTFYILKFFLLVALLSTACEQEDLTLEEPSHRVVFTSEMDFENKVNVGGEIALGDVSAGVVSRLWTFPEGVADILDSDNDVTSEEATVRVVFNTVGDHPVRLQQVFKEPAYAGTTQTNSTELDTTIIVRVLELVDVAIQANYVNPDGTLGEALNLADQSGNELFASRTIRYTPIVAGEPLHYTFHFEGGDPEFVEGAQEFIDVKYTRLGAYGVSFGASRTRPSGSDSISYNQVVRVIPSTDPILMDRVTEKDGQVAIVYSRELNPETLAPENFTVSIENGSIPFTVPVSTATLDPEQGNVILLTLDNESIYNDDIVRVSYEPGALTSADGVQADAFVDVLLSFPTENILKSTDFDYSFENSTADNWVYLWWGAPFDQYTSNVSSNQAFEGSKSLYVEFNANGAMIIGNRDANGENISFPVETGQDYELGLWVYVEELGNIDPAATLPDIRLYWTPDTDWGIGPNPALTADFPVGEWVYSSAFVSFNGEQASFMIRGVNEFNSAPVKAYIDNITLSKVRLRP
ncbi:MAG: hypothetical protein AAFO07_08040 [Bacteroidota bacterium]